MPQMSPIWWSMMFFIFILSYMMYMMIMYFFISYHISNDKTPMKNFKNMNWMW